MTQKENQWMELGDIIQIYSPTNPEWHENIFFVAYLDSTLIEIINVESSLLHLLYPTEEKSIEKIVVLSRSSFKGFARQNGLLQNTWVDLFFGGEVPKSITAEITNLEEDMIELTTYPENKILYIDFAYQGIPRHIPLKKICIRERPASYRRGRFSPDDESDEYETQGTFETGENNEMGENGQDVPEENINDRLQKLYQLAESEIEEELTEIIQEIEIPPEQQQYGIDAQVNDLLDAFLSTIPNIQRTPSVMNRIYTHIERFKELREQFSKYDPVYHRIVGPLRANSQPLVQQLSDVNKTYPWIIPVVSETRKIYFENDKEQEKLFEGYVDMVDIETTVVERDLLNEQKIENNTFYKNKTPEENTVKYANMYAQTASFMRNFEVLEQNSKNALHTIPAIKTDLDVLVSIYDPENTTDPFKVTTYQDSKRFLFKRYNSVVEYPYKRNPKSKEKSLKDPLIPADPLAFNSVVLLPEPFVAFSKLKCPNANIYQKSFLNSIYPAYYPFFHKKTEITQKEISLDQTMGEEDPRSLTKLSMNRIQHFILSSMDDTAQSLDSPDKLTAFLKKSIPTLKTLVDTYLQQQKRFPIYTFHDAVDVLEPFSIYMENIQWYVSNTIKQLLYKNINGYISQTALKASLFQSLILEKYRLELTEHINRLAFLLEEQKPLQKKCMESYVTPAESTEKRLNMQTSEWLQYVQDMDQGKLFSNSVKQMNALLYTPEFFEKNPFEDGNEIEGFKKDTCFQRVLAKKYNSISDLREDNNKTIFFDKTMDNTDYTLLEKYKKEQPELDDSEFLNFLAENLISKHNHSRDSAFQTARNIIAGERPIEEGQYALLENLPKPIENLDPQEESEEWKKDMELEAESKKRTMYFVRKKNIWVHVPELDTLSFMDNPSLLCQLQSNCYSSKKTKTSPEMCQPEQMTLQRMKQNEIEKMKSEFKDRYELSVEESKQSLENEFMSLERWIQQEKENQYQKKIHYDIRASAIGKRAVLQEFIESPQIKLRDSILQKNVDFVTKQLYILLFVDKFCREPMTEDPMNEDAYWLYCKESDTKLMPRSLYLLAKAYKEGNYTAVMNRLCNNVGKLSDDGDSYVDKYSGYVLKKIEWREEGFEIPTEGAGEGEDFGEDEPMLRLNNADQIVNKKAKIAATRIYDNEVDQKLYNLISAICRNIHMNDEILKDKMMQYCQQWLLIKSMFPDKTIYDAQVEKIKQKMQNNPKLKAPVSFEVYCKKKYIVIAALSVLVVIQTNLYNIDINRTFPGCVRSFSGFPLREGQDDLSSIQYIACVLRKMYTENKEESNLVDKKEGNLETILLEDLKKNILVRSEILRLYDNARIELSVKANLPETDQEIQVRNRWPHFLPPIFPVEIPAKVLQTISPQGHKNKDVYDLFLVKNRMLSLALVEYIREIVGKQNILFQTKSGFPYLQNACCSELLQYPPISTLDYFKKEDSTIEKTVEILQSMSLKINRMKQNNKAFVLLKESTSASSKQKENKSLIDDESEPTSKKNKRNFIYSMESILYYAAAIHYCKLDSEIYPIPESLTDICSKKPGQNSDEFYDKNMTMLEKMDYMQKNQIRMDAHKMIQLMHIIQKKNQVSIFVPADVSNKTKLKNALEKFQEKNADISPIKNIMEDWINATKDAPFPFVRKNNELKKEWFSFIRKNATQKPTDVELQVQTNIFYKWENYKDIPIADLAQHLKSWILQLGIIYPSFLRGNNCAFTEYTVPPHWGLTDNDEFELEKNTKQRYNDILQRFHKNTYLVPIFENIIDRVKPLYEFVENGLYYFLDHKHKKVGADTTNNNVENEDTIEHGGNVKKDFFDMVLFCVHLVMKLYMELIQHPSIYKISVNKIQEEKRERIQEERLLQNTNSDLMLNELDDDIEEIEIQLEETNENEIRRNMADLFLAMNQTFKSKAQVNMKEPVMMTYADIMKEISYSKDREKQRIKDHFKKMSREERKVEVELKKLHLGVFSINNQKLNKYGKQTGFYGDDYLNEVQENEADKDETIHELIELEEPDPDREIYAEDIDRDDNLDIQENEEDYGDMNEYAYDNMLETEYD